MIILDQAPELILPAHYRDARPAIIRPGVNPDTFFPVQWDRASRRAFVSELVKTGRIDRDDAVKVAAAIPFGMFKPTVSAGAPPVCTFLQGAANTSNASTYTFTSANLGTAASDRYIVVTYSFSQNSPVPSITSVTIGGVAATLIDDQSNSTTVGRTGMAIALVPTGTTGNIVIVTSATVARCSYSAYRITGLGSATPYDTNKGSSADPLAVTINVPQDGFTIASYSMNENATVTWTNLTERYDAVNEANAMHSSAMDSSMSGETARSISANASTGTRSAMVVASWI